MTCYDIIKRALLARPFVPFRLHMTDLVMCSVPSPECLIFLAGGSDFILVAEDGRTLGCFKVSGVEIISSVAPAVPAEAAGSWRDRPPML